VLDAYPQEDRDALRAAGGTAAGDLYTRSIRDVASEAVVHVAHPADPGFRSPAETPLADYDGAVWTGSSLTIHRAEDDRVRRQVELARHLFDAGVPSFGSCWAAQVAVVAAGGECAASSKGREFGISRRIRLGAEGLAHPLFQGKPPVFDAFTSHADEVTRLPPGARLLASNDWSRVQAVSVEHGRGTFWAVQYHPEYDLSEVAALCRLRREELVGQGIFASSARADAWISDALALHRDTARTDLISALDLDPALLDPVGRGLELRNWITAQVEPRLAARR